MQPARRQWVFSLQCNLRHDGHCIGGFRARSLRQLVDVRCHVPTVSDMRLCATVGTTIFSDVTLRPRRMGKITSSRAAGMWVVVQLTSQGSFLIVSRAHGAAALAEARTQAGLPAEQRERASSLNSFTWCTLIEQGTCASSSCPSSGGDGRVRSFQQFMIVCSRASLPVCM